MADTFLRIDGIAGSSTDARHAGSIEITSWDWSVAYPPPATGRGGGLSAAKAGLSALRLTKRVDATSPALLRYCMTGAMAREAVLETKTSSGPEGARFEIRLGDVLVSSVSLRSPDTDAGDSALFEEVTLLFSRIEFSHYANDPAGKATGAHTFGWDLAKNARVDGTGPSRPLRPSEPLPPPPPPRPPEPSHEPVPEKDPAGVQFTVSYPEVLPRGQWLPLLAYVHTRASTPAVRADIKARQKMSRAERLRTSDTQRQIAPDTELLIVPEADRVQFNPPSQRLLWLEDWHCAEFRVRTSAQGDLGPIPIIGRVRLYVEAVLIGEVALEFTPAPQGDARPAPAMESRTADAYESIFVSYSHNDTAIVERLAKAYKALGMTCLRDIESLRSGQNWSEELVRLIHQADIFQLYWSEAARLSQFVEREWREALRLQKPALIRPVYWQRPMPAPPNELAHLHFSFLDSV